MRHTIAHAPSIAGLVLVLLLAGRAPALAQPSSSGTRPPSAAADDAFARRGWHLELAAQGALEAWNYNGNHEELFGTYAGLTYGLGKGVVALVGTSLQYVSQRGTDGYQLGLTWGARGRIVRIGRTSVFWEVEVGISESDTFVPPRGTRFNYLALGSGGVTVRLRDQLHLLGALKWTHVSNNSLAGRDRNPDIEAIGLKLGALLAF